MQRSFFMLLTALKILLENARRDPLNNAVLPLIGAGLLALAWYRGWLSADVIRVIVCHDDLC